MAVKDRIIEIAYKLKDQFTGGVSKLTGSLKKVESQYNATGDRINNITKRIGRSAANIGKVLAAGVGVGFTAIGARLVSLSGDIDRLAKTSRKLGIDVGPLQRLEHAAKLSGVQVNQLESGLQRMVRRVSEAARGTGEAQGAIDELGLSAKELNQLSPDEQFLAIAQALSEVPNQADRVRLAFKLFDAEGVNLLKMMDDGAQGVKNMGDQLDRMGGIVDQKTVKAVERLNDNMTTLSANMDALILRFGPDILETLNRGLSGLGLSAERGIGNIELELRDLYNTRRDLIEDIEKGPQTRGLWDALFGDSYSEKEDELITTESRIRELLDLVRTRAMAEGDAKRKTEDLTDATEDLGEETKDTKDKIKDEKDELTKYNKALKTAKKRVDAYKDAKKDANKVQLEFDDFVEGLGGGGGQDDPPDYIDASYERMKAQNALDTGNYDEAIERARSAADMVEQIGKSGEYSSYEVTNLGKTIRNVAVEAANRKAEATLIDGEKEKTEIEQIKELLSSVPANIDQASLSQSFREALQTLQAEASQNPVVVRVQTIQETTRNGVRGYSDGTDYIETEARKRGTRPQ